MYLVKQGANDLADHRRGSSTGYLVHDRTTDRAISIFESCGVMVRRRRYEQHCKREGGQERRHHPPPSARERARPVRPFHELQAEYAENVKHV